MLIYHLVGHYILLMSKHNDEVIDGELRNEISHIYEQYRNKGQISYPNSRFIKSYVGRSSLPKQFKVPFTDLDVGYHFVTLEKSTGGEKAYYVAVNDQPDGHDKFYIFYDYTLHAAEYVDYQLFRASKRFFLALAVVALLGLCVGLYISQKLSSPLKRLVLEVKDVNPERLPINFAGNFKNDEVGILAQTLENSMQRIEEFIEREKNFTRDSSHELRTPVTIIKGAVEIIRQLPECSNVSLAKPVTRIERSLADMEGIIETFLWLAREQNKNPPKESCLVADVVRHEVEQNRYLINEKPIAVDMLMDDNPRIPVPENVFRIIVVNLIRNAFLYTNSGKINIVIKPDLIEISNSGDTIPPDLLRYIKEPFQRGDNNKGFGIGLAIVDRLCRRFSLRLAIESNSESHTCVTLNLAH